MKIAVTYENGKVFAHFGHTEYFKIYEAADKNIVSSNVVAVSGGGHSALAEFLKNQGVNVLICGGIGGCARNALDAANILIFGGVSGEADKAAEDFVSGRLAFDPNAGCSHSVHSGGHNCGGSCK